MKRSIYHIEYRVWLEHWPAYSDSAYMIASTPYAAFLALRLKLDLLPGQLHVQDVVFQGDILTEEQSCVFSAVSGAVSAMKGGN